MFLYMFLYEFIYSVFLVQLPTFYVYCIYIDWLDPVKKFYSIKGTLRSTDASNTLKEPP